MSDTPTREVPPSTPWRYIDVCCKDCRVDTIALREVYMVHREIWSAAGMLPYGGALCIGCLEQRIGRQLVPEDFPPFPVNGPDRQDERCTSRLRERLGLPAVKATT
jgi:hypothetical protein